MLLANDFPTLIIRILLKQLLKICLIIIFLIARLYRFYKTLVNILFIKE